jgi:hypothetical protein
MIIEKMDSLRGYVKNYINGLINEINSHTELQVTVSENKKASKSIPQKEQTQIGKEKPRAKVTKKQRPSKVSPVKGISKNSKVISPRKNSVIQSKKDKNKTNTKSSVSTKIDKFVWLKSRKSLERLLDKLSEVGLIINYTKNSIPQHFTIQNDNKVEIKAISNKHNKKINWFGENTELIVLIFQLRLDGCIYIKGERYHKYAFNHFDRNGVPLNESSLRTQKSQIIDSRKRIKEKEKFANIINLIIDVKDL